MHKVVTLEKNRDENRARKLEKLLNSKKGGKNINTAEIVNLTPHEIPPEIQEFLRFGRNKGIGGPKKNIKCS
jgi:hypothetical protein